MISAGSSGVGHGRWWLGFAIALVMPWAIGCADEAGFDQAQSGLEWQARDFRPVSAAPRFEAKALPAEAIAREIARQKLDQAANACGRCGEGECVLQCLVEDDLLGFDGEPECLACGRETGFLPRPILNLEQLGEKTIELSWDPVAGASRYTVYGMEWAATGPSGAGMISHVWQTAETRLRLTLEEGSSYRFQLVAWDDGTPKRRSQPSDPVHVDL